MSTDRETSTQGKNTPVPYLIYVTPDGEIHEEPRLQALAFGNDPLNATDLIPLPDGVTLSMMPDRLAVGLRRSGATYTLPSTRGWAAAALLPIGYTRTHLPAYEKVPETEPLPFFGYSAVAGLRGRLYVAALRTDDGHLARTAAVVKDRCAIPVLRRGDGPVEDEVGRAVDLTLLPKARAH